LIGNALFSSHYQSLEIIQLVESQKRMDENENMNLTPAEGDHLLLPVEGIEIPPMSQVSKLALWYVPAVFGCMILASSGGNFGGYYLFIYSGMCLVILLPFYTIYLVRHVWQRFKQGTLTGRITLLYILSFFIPFLFMMMFATFNGSPA